MANIIENDYDYKVITIDSDCATFYSSTTCDFYINLDEPLRNVYKINIIVVLLNILNNSPLNITLDSIYVNLNNYNRLIGKNKTAFNNTKYNINAFDSIIIENAITTTGGNTTLKNDYNNTDTIYYLNPLEPQLTRFNIRLFDKNNVIINKSDISRFVLKIGVYYNNKKTTRI